MHSRTERWWSKILWQRQPGSHVWPAPIAENMPGPGTGRHIRSEGVEIFRIADGKIVEGWSRFVLPLGIIESRENGETIGDLDAIVELISDRRPGPARSALRRVGRLFRAGRG